MHETFFRLPAGHVEKTIFQLVKEYGHPIDNLPNRMELQFEPLATISVQQGPPDWVPGQEGMTYTCEDVTIMVCTRLPTLEGSLDCNL
jgi:hypothetical protein